MAHFVGSWGSALGTSIPLRAKIRQRRLLMSITTSEIAAFLESHHLFAALPPVKLNELAQQCELREQEAGMVVYSAGDQAAWLYLIYSGAMALTGSSRGSSRIPRELTRLQEGDFFGGLAMLQGAQHFDTTTLLQPTLLLALEHNVLGRLVRECEPISARIGLDNRSLQMLRKRQPGLRPQESVNLLCVPYWAWLAYAHPLALLHRTCGGREPQTAAKSIVAGELRYFLPRFREQRGNYVAWRKHPLMLIKRLAGGVLGIVFISLVAISGPGSAPAFAGPLSWDAFLVFGYGLFAFWAWYQFEDWRADVYMLTPARLVDAEKKPLLGRLSQRSAPIESVLNVSCDRPGVLVNLFNFGTVTIESGGETGRLTFDWVGNPLSVQQENFLQLEQYFERREDEEAQHRQREIADWLTVYDDITRPPTPD